MKLFAFFLALVCLVSGQAYAGNFVATDATPQDVRGTASVRAGVEKVQGDVLRYEAFVLVAPDWAEALVGPAIAVTDWVTLGLSAGVEQSDGRFAARYAATAYLSHETLSLFTVVEANNTVLDGHTSEVWYETVAHWQAMPVLAIGLRDRRFVGVGPTADLTLGRSGFHLYGAWMPLAAEVWKLQPHAGIIGLSADL